MVDIAVVGSTDTVMDSIMIMTHASHSIVS